MAKKRRVARQKYMDRVREVDQERRAYIAKRQELGEQKRLKKRKEIELAKRERQEDGSPIDQLADDANAEQQQKNAVITQDRTRLKKLFGNSSALGDEKRDRDGNKQSSASTGNTASSNAQRGGTGPTKARRVEQD